MDNGRRERSTDNCDSYKPHRLVHAVLAGVLLNNKRLEDFKDLLKANIETRAAARDLYGLRVLIEKNHSELLLKISDVDIRISRLRATAG